jgi:transcriptional regulator with XRE-family HTH domain
MKLADYLAAKEMADADFATAIGVTRQAVHRYKTGERMPEWAVLARIKDVTAGEVSPDDFLQSPPQPAESSAA